MQLTGKQCAGKQENYGNRHSTGTLSKPLLADHFIVSRRKATHPDPESGFPRVLLKKDPVMKTQSMRLRMPRSTNPGSARSSNNRSNSKARLTPLYGQPKKNAT